MHTAMHLVGNDRSDDTTCYWTRCVTVNAETGSHANCRQKRRWTVKNCRWSLKRLAHFYASDVKRYKNNIYLAFDPFSIPQSKRNWTILSTLLSVSLIIISSNFSFLPLLANIFTINFVDVAKRILKFCKNYFCENRIVNYFCSI